MKKQTRRQFVLTTAGAAATAPFISTSVTRAKARQSRKLGFALCGLGGLSARQIAPALQQTEYCRLAGVITGSADKAREWQEHYGIPDERVYTYDTMHRLADAPDIHVVYILTPNVLHLPHTLAAVQAGKHVFCEKPMEVSVERCQQMIDACRNAGLRLGIAYRCQFEPHHLECMRIARERELGEPRLIEASFGIRIGDPGQWRLRHALSGGGALIDVGIYALQATRYLTGEEPELVCAMETRSDPVKFREVDESMTWQARFPSGVLASCSTSYNVSGMGRIRVHTDQGWFGLEPAFNYSGIRGHRSDGKPLERPEVNQFAAEMDDFARCILEGRPTRVSGEEGLQDVKIMMAIYESARTGRAVKVT